MFQTVFKRYEKKYLINSEQYNAALGFLSYNTVPDSSGNVIASFTPEKQYNSIVISAPGLNIGEKYKLVLGGKISGSDEKGYASSGKVMGAESSYDVELSSVSVSYGSAGGGNQGGMGGGFKQMR